MLQMNILQQKINPKFRMTSPFNPIHILTFLGAQGNAFQGASISWYEMTNVRFRRTND